uniref:PH domain-containing protein n=1 Tax=Cacopsylla melanoneura TaxID=428564 RepID=A0A8D8SBH0_9HEMI
MLSKVNGCNNINHNDGTITPDDNFVPFENINDNFLQSVHNNNILDINSNSNIVLESAIHYRKSNKNKIKKRVSFHESALMDSKEDSDSPPREVRVRHSWHGYDADVENDNTMETFWNLFSLETDTLLAESNSSEIGQEVLVEDNVKDVECPTNLTAKVQNIIESISKMSETNININKKQLLNNVDNVFEAIKTKIGPCAEGEIPADRRSFYWTNESEDIHSREVCEVGKIGSPITMKKQSLTPSNCNGTTSQQWHQTRVHPNPKVMLVKKFLKSIPPIHKRSKTSANILKCATEKKDTFKTLTITNEMKLNATRNFFGELGEMYLLKNVNQDVFSLQVKLTENLVTKYTKLLNLAEDNYMHKVYKVLNKYGDPVMLILTRRLLILCDRKKKNCTSVDLKDICNIIVGEQTITIECKDSSSLTVISNVDIDAVSTIISNIEILFLKQHLVPSAVSAKPQHLVLSLLEKISSQTQYFNKCDEIVLYSWSWIEQFSDISRSPHDQIYRNGNLMYKLNENSSWTPGFVFLQDGTLTVKETANSLKNLLVIQCQSYCQVYDRSRPYTFKVNFNPYSFVLLAAPDESQLFDWLQDIMISIKINDDKTHMGPSEVYSEDINGNYVLVSPSHIICYKYPHRVNLVVPLQQVSAFKLSKTCDYCVMELSCLEASEDELLNDVAFHFVSKSKLEQFSNALLTLRHFQISDNLLLHEQTLNNTNKKLKQQWDKYLQ